MNRPAQRRLSCKEEIQAIAKAEPLSPRPVAVLPPATGPPELADDLLMGAAAISTFMFGAADQRRRVYWLADIGQLPVFRIGSILCARKSSILKAVELHERAAITERATA
jgi:hypothetical protein